VGQLDLVSVVLELRANAAQGAVCTIDSTVHPAGTYGSSHRALRRVGRLTGSVVVGFG
jgi:hypothetical protein